MSRQNAPKKQIAHPEATVRTILDHHLTSGSGGAKTRITPLSGGLTNSVFSVKHPRGRFIVRLNRDPRKVNTFRKEEWAIGQARKLGVPVPEIVEIGNEAAPVAYMIARQSHGTEATDHPDRTGILRQLGRYAAKIHGIRTTGFGTEFDLDSNEPPRNRTWADFLETDLELEQRLEVLTRTRMLSPRRIQKLRSTLRNAATRKRTSVLNHGDLRLKNVLVDKDAKISCILDWEHCVSSLAPEWDWSITLHDLSINDKQALLRGYGANLADIERFAPTAKALNLINYVPEIQLAEKRRNRDKLDWFRIRLSGLLDLYCD